MVVEGDFMDVGDLYDGGTARDHGLLIPRRRSLGHIQRQGFLTSGTYFVAAV